MKGTILLYAGQEVCEKHTPSLFEKEPVDWNSGEDISGYLAKARGHQEEAAHR